MIYWVKLRSGELQIRGSEPKDRPYVQEVRKEIAFQHYRHELVLFNGRKFTLVRSFDSRCGYDRGPKLQEIVKGMLL